MKIFIDGIQFVEEKHILTELDLQILQDNISKNIDRLATAEEELKATRMNLLAQYAKIQELLRKSPLK